MRHPRPRFGASRDMVDRITRASLSRPSVVGSATSLLSVFRGLHIASHGEFSVPISCHVDIDLGWASGAWSSLGQVSAKNTKVNKYNNAEHTHLAVVSQLN